MKATRLTRQSCKKSFKLDQAFMNDVEKKREFAFLSLEDYHFDILNMLTHYSGVFRVRTSKINK